MKKVLVTGATGLVGSWVARELISGGYEVRALVRSTSSLANLETLPIERAEGDVLDAASVRRALEGCDGLVHTAGIAHFQPGNEAQMYAVNVEGVKIVLEAALEAGVRRAVVTSSTGAIGGSMTPRIADETTPSNAEALKIDYLITKYRGEQAALELARRGLPVCAVRPAFVLGPGDIYRSSATTMLALARRQMPVYVAGGASFCDVRDVARGHVAALERGIPGQVYNLGGNNMEMDTLVATVAGVAGVRPPRRVPYGLAYTVAAVMETTSRLLGLKLDLSRQLVMASRLYTYVGSEKAEKELGYSIRPFEESLRDTLKFFLAVGRLKASTPQLRALAKEAGSSAASAGRTSGAAASG